MTEKQRNTLIGLAVVLLCICVAFAGFYALLSGNSDPQSAADFAKEYGGNVDVYQQILLSNDCDWLQGQFDTAYANSEQSEPGTVNHKRATGFMTASDKRMKEIGCY